MARKGLILRIMDWCVLAATFGAAAALLCAYLAPSVNPNGTWFLAYAGLAAPVLYMANLFLMLYWAIRWKPAFFLPLLLLLAGLSKINDYYRAGEAKPAEAKEPGSIKVLTYNVEGFVTHNAGKRVSSVREITGFIRENDPDIICLQEFQTAPGMPQTAIDSLLRAWPHRAIHYTTRLSGSAIYSKFPIVHSDILAVAGNRKGVLWAQMAVAGDTLRVICNHLESTNIQNDDLRFLQPGHFAGDPDKGGRIRRIAARLRRGFRTRAMQADTIAALIGGRDLPTLVCGDFNDPPMSYAYRTIRGKYRDAFEDKGHGYGYTYKRLYRLLRIDYILPSRHFETLSYDSPDVPWSDHNPVIAVIGQKQKE